MIGTLVAAHIAACAVTLIAGRRLGAWSLAVAALPMLAAFVFMSAQAARVLDGAVPTDRWTWVEELSLTASFRLDGFAVLMALVVSGVGLLVLAYASAYFGRDERRERVVRFAAFFSFFAGAMVGLVCADDVWTLFTFWELTSVSSFVLIGYDDERPETRIAAQRALLTTAAGGLVMLAGFVWLTHAAGTSDLASVIAAVPTSGTTELGAALVLIGAMTKSAQVPFHFWLPGAMAAPTPVSAYLHSATMVKAGVVVVARFAPSAVDLSWWRPALVVIGGVTMLAGGVAALRRTDAKQSLAFGTVSQLGFLVVMLGVGDGAVTAGGVAWLVAHALFKSTLFLAIGTVEHATGSRDLRRLSGVGRAAPLLAAAAGLATLSMIGVPPLLGFAAKEAALAALGDGDGWLTVALVVVVAGSVLTTAYSVRLWWGLFTSSPATSEPAVVHHAPSGWLLAPIVLLAGVSVAAGIAAPAVGRRLAVAAEHLDAHAHLHLTLWPGLHSPLVLSTVIVVAGSVVGGWTIRRRDRRLEPTLGERAYSRVYNGLLDGAGRVTMITQSGSLPLYVAVVLTVTTAAGCYALIRGAGNDWNGAVLADSLLQGAVAILTALLCVAVVAARRRIVSVLLLGGVGQGLTVLFLLYGAPDLALTQFMVETLMIVAFVLVLRHIGHEDSSRPAAWVPTAVRVGLSVAVGITIAWFALAAGSTDRPTDVTDAVEALSLPEAGGRNVVNVTIVDFRGIDTLGEITVFGIAALGVGNIVVASRRAVGRAPRTRPARIGANSMIFDQVVKMIFHATVLVSLYVMLRGHNAPGGGFAGGLIAGAAFVFQILAGESTHRPVLRRISPVALIALGMMLAVGTGLAPLLAGNEFLESSVFHVHPPLVGDVKLVTAAVFDLGVYVLVIGVVIVVLNHLASRTHSGGAAVDPVGP